MAGPDFLAKSRALAKIALAGSLGLVVMVVLLPFLIDHTTVSEGLILVWAIFLLLTAIILGVALAYVFMTGGVRGPGGTPAAEGAPPPSSEAVRPTAPPGGAEASAPDLALRLLSGDEASLYRRILAAGGTVLQKDLVGAGLFSGPKVSRILDRLEAKGLVARERHGMTNRIRLSDAWREKA